VSDGDKTSETATTTITINPINDEPPVVSSSAISVDESSVDTNLGLTAPTDIDNDPLTITVTGLPTLGTVTKADGTVVNNDDTLTEAELEGLIYDAPDDYNGTDDPGDFTYSVSDNNETVSGSVDITINPINDPPVVSSSTINVDESSEDTSLGLTSPTDVDGDNLTITVTGLPTLGTVTKADGTVVNNGDTLTNSELTSLIYDAPADYNGTDDPGDFTYEVTDGNETVPGAVNITINTIPVVDSNTITVNEASVDTSLGLSQPTDVDGDNLTITVTGLPTLGTVTKADGTVVNNGDTLTNSELTSLIYDAPADYNGTDDPGDFTYEVTDGNETVPGAVNITINTIPVVDSNTITVNEASVDTSLGLSQPTDVDGDNLTITVTGIPNLGTVTKADGTVVNNGDTLTNSELTSLVYDAPANYDGSDPGNFTYTVTDGNETVEGSVDITINTVNNAPIANNDSVGTTKDTAISIDVLADNGNGKDSDPDNDELTVTQVNGTDINPGDTIPLPSGALLTFNTDGTFSYDPNNQFNSLTGTATDTDSFTYTVFDGTETSEATVTVTIAGENSPPVAENDAVSIDANTVLTGNVLTDNGNGEDSDPDGNEITVNQINNESVNMGQPITLDSGAEIILNEDGTFSYNPNGQFDSLGVGETATDTFTYTINDGISDSEPATVTITINGVNDNPIATEDNLQTSPQRPLTFNPLTNDTDPRWG
jgi:VCBS repeat-containing protein